MAGVVSTPIKRSTGDIPDILPLMNGDNLDYVYIHPTDDNNKSRSGKGSKPDSLRGSLGAKSLGAISVFDPDTTGTLPRDVEMMMPTDEVFMDGKVTPAGQGDVRLSGELHVNGGLSGTTDNSDKYGSPSQLNGQLGDSGKSKAVDLGEEAISVRPGSGVNPRVADYNIQSGNSTANSHNGYTHTSSNNIQGTYSLNGNATKAQTSSTIAVSSSKVPAAGGIGSLPNLGKSSIEKRVSQVRTGSQKKDGSFTFKSAYRSDSLTRHIPPPSQFSDTTSKGEGSDGTTPQITNSRSDHEIDSISDLINSLDDLDSSLENGSSLREYNLDDHHGSLEEQSVSTSGNRGSVIDTGNTYKDTDVSNASVVSITSTSNTMKDKQQQKEDSINNQASITRPKKPHQDSPWQTTKRFSQTSSSSNRSQSSEKLSSPRSQSSDKSSPRRDINGVDSPRSSSAARNSSTAVSKSSSKGDKGDGKSKSGSYSFTGINLSRKTSLPKPTPRRNSRSDSLSSQKENLAGKWVQRKTSGKYTLQAGSSGPVSVPVVNRGSEGLTSLERKANRAEHRQLENVDLETSSNLQTSRTTTTSTSIGSGRDRIKSTMSPLHDDKFKAEMNKLFGGTSSSVNYSQSTQRSSIEQSKQVSSSNKNSTLQTIVTSQFSANSTTENKTVQSGSTPTSSTTVVVPPGTIPPVPGPPPPPISYNTAKPNRNSKDVEKGTVSKLVRDFRDVPLTGRTLDKKKSVSVDKDLQHDTSDQKYKFEVEGIDIPARDEERTDVKTVVTPQLEGVSPQIETHTTESNENAERENLVSDSLEREKKRGFTYLLDRALVPEVKKRAEQTTLRKPHEVVEVRLQEQKIARNDINEIQTLRDARARLSKQIRNIPRPIPPPPAPDQSDLKVNASLSTQKEASVDNHSLHNIPSVSAVGTQGDPVGHKQGQNQTVLLEDQHTANTNRTMSSSSQAPSSSLSPHSEQLSPDSAYHSDAQTPTAYDAKHIVQTSTNFAPAPQQVTVQRGEIDPVSGQEVHIQSSSKSQKYFYQETRVSSKVAGSSSEGGGTVTRSETRQQESAVQYAQSQNGVGTEQGVAVSSRDDVTVTTPYKPGVSVTGAINDPQPGSSHVVDNYSQPPPPPPPLPPINRYPQDSLHGPTDGSSYHVNGPFVNTVSYDGESVPNYDHGINITNGDLPNDVTGHKEPGLIATYSGEGQSFFDPLQSGDFSVTYDEGENAFALRSSDLSTNAELAVTPTHSHTVHNSVYRDSRSDGDRTPSRVIQLKPVKVDIDRIANMQAHSASASPHHGVTAPTVKHIQTMLEMDEMRGGSYHDTYYGPDSSPGRYYDENHNVYPNGQVGQPLHKSSYRSEESLPLHDMSDPNHYEMDRNASLNFNIYVPKQKYLKVDEARSGKMPMYRDNDIHYRDLESYQYQSRNHIRQGHSAGRGHRTVDDYNDVFDGDSIHSEPAAYRLMRKTSSRHSPVRRTFISNSQPTLVPARFAEPLHIQPPAPPAYNTLRSARSENNLYHSAPPSGDETLLSPSLHDASKESGRYHITLKLNQLVGASSPSRLGSSHLSTLNRSGHTAADSRWSTLERTQQYSDQRSYNTLQTIPTNQASHNRQLHTSSISLVNIEGDRLRPHITEQVHASPNRSVEDPYRRSHYRPVEDPYSRRPVEQSTYHSRGNRVEVDLYTNEGRVPRRSVKESQNKSTQKYERRHKEDRLDWFRQQVVDDHPDVGHESDTGRVPVDEYVHSSRAAPREEALPQNWGKTNKSAPKMGVHDPDITMGVNQTMTMDYAPKHPTDEYMGPAVNEPMEASRAPQNYGQGRPRKHRPRERPIEPEDDLTNYLSPAEDEPDHDSDDELPHVVRGSILIKNAIDTAGAPRVVDVVETDMDDEFVVEDNTNMFHGKYFQSRENPMYSSDEDLRRLGRKQKLRQDKPAFTEIYRQQGDQEGAESYMEIPVDYARPQRRGKISSLVLLNLCLDVCINFRYHRHCTTQHYIIVVIPHTNLS